MNIRNNFGTTWLKMPTPRELQGGTSWCNQINDVWKNENAESIRLCQVRFFTSQKFGAMTHYVMKKIDKKRLAKNQLSALRYSEELSYEEKLEILKKLYNRNKYAVEVLPKKRKIVDATNLYHMWEFKDGVLPFSLDPIFNPPDDDDFETFYGKEEYQYASRGVKTNFGRVGYLYIKKDGKRLEKWIEKQYVKDETVGEDIEAVEVISEKMSKLGYTCLICMPLDYSLDFGLHM